MIDAALDYARRGFYVFPLAPGTKIPARGSRGFLDATIDADTIRSWWTAAPDANIGLSLEPSGLVLLDVDVADGKGGRESLAELDADLPPTLTAASARGGLHAFYRGAHPVRLTGFRPGLDLYGKGYVLVAPSRLTGDAFVGAAPGASGVYTWHDPSAAIAPVPTVLTAIARARAAAPVIPPDDQAPIITGSRNTALHALGAALRRAGLTHDPILAALILTNKERVRPPLDPAEIGRIALSVSRYAANDVAAATAFVDDEPAPTAFAEELGRALIDVRGHLEIKVSNVTAPLFAPASDLFTRAYPPTPWLVRGLMTDGRQVTVVGGEPKTTKTWALTEIAMAVASGTRAFGEYPTTTPKRVAYFYAEDQDRSVRNHLRALAIGRGLTPDVASANLFVQPRGRFLDVTKDEDLALLVASVRALGGVDLLCLDPLRDISSAEEDSSDAMSDVMRRLRLLGEILTCGIAVVHHTAKASETTSKRRPGQRLRGSGAIHGAIDCGIYLSNLSGDGQNKFVNDVEIEIKAAQGAGRFSLALEIIDDAEGTATEARWNAKHKPASVATDVLSDLLSLLALAEIKREPPPTHRQILKILKGGNAALIETLRQAEESGFVQKFMRGRLHRGWILTDAGRGIMRADPTPTGTDTEPALSGFADRGNTPLS